MKNIKVKGAKEHNLKNLDLDIPRDKLVVFTGVSGSGKSSLVFDTIFLEAQRQYLDSLSVYARSRLPKFNRPNVDKLTGLSPAIVIDQKRLGRNPRSTVGTATEIYTYLRLLYSRCGEPILGDSGLFSFNTPEGMCQSCKGLGKELVLEIDNLLNRSKSLSQGAIRHSRYKIKSRYLNIIRVSELFDMDKPLLKFTKEELNTLLYSKPIPIISEAESGFIQKITFEGIVRMMKRRNMDERGATLTIVDSRYFKLTPCRECQGTRLNKKASEVKVNGKTLPEISKLELTELNKFIKTVKGPLAEEISKKIDESLSHLIDIGVGYLSLNQPVKTLSGGESQRVKMARQLGTDLIELVYILDEPSIGLHQKDIYHLLNMLKKLRDQGNTVLVVEHDPAVINIADHVIDIGPHAGVHGGNLIFQGTVNELKKSESITAKYLNKHRHKKKTTYRKPNGIIPIKNASINNLKNVSVDIPRGVFVCITGVAGSGKSSLINDTFAKRYPQSIVVTQSAIGASNRSNPATYTGAFNIIRNEFARETGQEISLFSFNAEGACPDCKGSGFIKTEMHFLGDIKTTCNTCKGKRYQEKALQYKYKEKNIAEVLNMTIRQSGDFFHNDELKRRLQILDDVGLGYLTLGQPLHTLSGGEAQRIKLASELHKKGNIYILDEPTTGLHMADIEKLLKMLDTLVDSGNTVIVIEHNLDVIANSDWIIDLGPEGGKKGGKIIAEGNPDEIAKVKESYTGQYLKQLPALY